MLKGGTPGGSVEMEAFLDGSSLGSQSFALGLVEFAGIQEAGGFDQLRLTVTQGTGNGFPGIDDLRFESSVVPIPAAVWLFGSGLLGLVGIARRKKA